MYPSESGSSAMTWTLPTRVQDVMGALVRMGPGLGVGVGLN